MKYTLMNKNTPILDLLIDETNNIIKILDVHNIKYLPLGVSVKKGIPNPASLKEWWNGRAIPASRSGLQNALFELGIRSQQHLITKSFGLSLSDQYWINPASAPLNWKNINFFDNTFSEDVGNALFGNINHDKELNLISPDNTSDGWLKKKWKIVEGNRCLIKSGSGPYYQEPLNEVIASKLYERLNNFDYVKYDTFIEDDLPYSICKNFITSDTEYIPAYQIYTSIKKQNHISSYEHLINTYKYYGVNDVIEYLDYTMTCDYILKNTDRHLNNFGLVRNVNTLKILHNAPIFDSGTSLWHDVQTELISGNRPVLSKPFKKYHNQQIKMVNSFDNFDLKMLNGFSDEINEIIKKYPTITHQRRSVLCKGLEKNIENLKAEISERYRNKTLLVETSNNTESATLLSSTETSVMNIIKAAGYKPTQNLIINIKALNNLLGKEQSIQDLMNLYKHKHKLAPEEKLLINAIGKEFIIQDEITRNKSKPIKNQFPEL